MSRANEIQRARRRGVLIANPQREVSMKTNVQEGDALEAISQEMVGCYVSLPLNELAMLMSDEAHRADVLAAARLSPSLMERFCEASELIASPLTPDDYVEYQLGRRPFVPVPLPSRACGVAGLGRLGSPAAHVCPSSVAAIAGGPKLRDHAHRA